MDAKLKAKAMTNEQLDNVAGGYRTETYGDGNILYKLGLITEKEAGDCTPVREKIHALGYKYKDNGGLDIPIFGGTANEYYDKNGNSVSRSEFWRGFAADHPELMKGKNINDLL